MLAYIPAPWILWAMIKNPFYQSLNITHCLLSRLLLTIINRHKNPPDPPRRGNHAGTTSRNHAGTTSRESSPDHHKVASPSSMNRHLQKLARHQAICSNQATRDNKGQLDSSQGDFSWFGFEIQLWRSKSVLERVVIGIPKHQQSRNGQRYEFLLRWLQRLQRLQTFNNHETTLLNMLKHKKQQGNVYDH